MVYHILQYFISLKYASSVKPATKLSPSEFKPRHPKFSLAEFQDYWLNHHGPLFKKFADTYRAVRYVQGHTIDTPLNENIQKSRGLSEPYDGVGEIWWQSEADFLSAINSPEGQKLRKIFIEDEAKFQDLKASSAFFTVEHILVDGKV